MKATKDDKQATIEIKDNDSSEVNQKRGIKKFFSAIGWFIKSIALLPMRSLLFFVEKIGELFKFSLAYKIAISYALLGIIAFSAIFIFATINTANTWLESEKESLLLTVEQEANQYRINGIPEEIEVVEDAPIHLIKMLLSNGLLENGNQLSSEFDFKIESGESQLLTIEDENYIAAAVSFKYQGEVYHLELFKNITLQVGYMKRQVLVLFSFVLLGLLLIIYTGQRISYHLLSPIARMTAEIKAIDLTELDERLNVNKAQDELKELATQFNFLLDTIENSYQRNNQFVSDASHELRTPLSVIDGYVNLLGRWGKKDEAVLDEAIEEIKEETAHMRNLIEKLLFIARTEQGKQTIKMEVVNLSAIVKEVCRETSMIDSEHKVSCEVGKEEEADIYISANSDYIKQMLRIFIENSRKFTDAGGEIKLICQREAEKVLLAVSDSGCGIDSADLPYVFDRFYKSDKARSNRKEGNGLGLAIAKWIIDQHGATVQIASEVEKGTTFTIYFD